MFIHSIVLYAYKQFVTELTKNTGRGSTTLQNVFQSSLSHDLFLHRKSKTNQKLLQSKNIWKYSVPASSVFYNPSYKLFEGI